MEAPSILIVDDEPAAAEYMAVALGTEFKSIRTAADGVEALLAMEEEVPDLVISDVHMPRMDGLELLTFVKQRWPAIPFILVTVEQGVSVIVEAVRRGAINYLVKPVSPGPLLAAVRKVVNSTAAKPSADSRIPEIVGTNQAIVRVRHLVAMAARSDVNVLITGETGTGKELAARAIHRLSALARKPLVVCNCALVPSELFESEFFGHRRGAFTGADRDHTGLLAQSDGGFLFLDELESMSLPHQAKLLRVLDDGEVRPVGSNETRIVSVRFLAATNRDPLALIARGALREDLHYRLRGFEINIPPLREHAEDIPLLASHHLGGDADRLTEEALDALRHYSWPGNVRQLQNVLESARAMAGEGEIALRHLSLEPIPGREPPSAGAQVPSADVAGADSGTLKEAERQAILHALRDCRGNRTRAAQALKIHRSTLRRKMRDLGI